mgnify:CR=1 FL=1
MCFQGIKWLTWRQSKIFFSGLEPKTPWLRRQTSLRVGVSESFACLSYESHFLRKTQNFSQNLSARDWILIDESVWSKSKKEW